MTPIITVMVLVMAREATQGRGEEISHGDPAAANESRLMRTL